MENQQPQVPPIAASSPPTSAAPVANSVPMATTMARPLTTAPTLPSALSTPTTGEWPAVPPAPAPIKPPAPVSAPEPLLVKPTAPVIVTAAADTSAVATVARASLIGPTEVDDDSPTMTIAIGPAAPEPGLLAPPRQPARPAAGPAARPAPGAAPSAEESPLVQLQRSVRRQQTYARNPREDLVWQPKFAYASALLILLALTVVSLPLWIVLYRISGPATNDGAGPAVADLVALCMMLMGGFLTGAAAWVIIIEMRGRVRMVDTLAKTGEREVMIAPAAPEIPVLDAPLDRMLAEPIGPARVADRVDPIPWEAPPVSPPSIAARAEAQQVSAAATLEASSKLLSSFSSVLKSFGQLHAQVAMLAVALALFVGATVLSMR